MEVSVVERCPHICDNRSVMHLGNPLSGDVPWCTLHYYFTLSNVRWFYSSRAKYCHWMGKARHSNLKITATMIIKHTNFRVFPASFGSLVVINSSASSKVGNFLNLATTPSTCFLHSALYQPRKIHLSSLNLFAVMINQFNGIAGTIARFLGMYPTRGVQIWSETDPNLIRSDSGTKIFRIGLIKLFRSWIGSDLDIRNKMN